MSVERSSSVADGDIPSWASPMHQGREDGSRRSQRRKSLECMSTTISIPQSEYIRSNSTGGHQVYIMHISSGRKSWQVPRRYSDFHYLDIQLRKFVLRRDMPAFPPKRFIGSSTDKKFVEERRIELERYITVLVGCPTAWNASDFVRFIDNAEGSIMMIWNLEKMRRVQDTLSTMTLDNRSETAKLSAELARANEQVAALQERISRMEMMFLQQVTGAATDNSILEPFQNMSLITDGVNGDERTGRSLTPPGGGPGLDVGPDRTDGEGGGETADMDAVVQDAIGCWSRPASPQMSPAQVVQVLDMTAAAVLDGRARALSATRKSGGDSNASPVDETQLTRKSFPRSASTSLQNKSASIEDVHARAVCMQLQEAVEISNEVLEPFELLPTASVDSGIVVAVPRLGADSVGTVDQRVVGAEADCKLLDISRCSETLASCIDQVVCALLPTRREMVVRHNVLLYIRGVVSSTLNGAECFAIGSHVSNTYLPNGDIDITIVLASDGTVKGAAASNDDPWFVKLNEALCMASMGKIIPPMTVSTGASAGIDGASAKMLVSNVSFVNAEVKIVKSQINGVCVDITCNRISAMYAQAMVEYLDGLVSKDHLLKRSLLLIKAWIINEAPRHTAGGGSIAGAQSGGLKSWCIAVMTIWIFNAYGVSIENPIQALALFLRYYSTFSWTKYAITVAGPLLAEGLLPLDINDPNRPDHPGLFPDSILSDFQLRFEHSKMCSANAASGDDKTTPFTPFVSSIRVSSPEPSVAPEETSENGGTTDGALGAAADSSVVAPPTYTKLPKSQPATPWLAAAAFGGDSAENYRRGILNVVDPVQLQNNLSTAVTIASFHSIVAVFQKGYSAVSELIDHTAGAYSTSAEDLVKQFMLNTTTQLSGMGRGLGRGPAESLQNLYATVLSSQAVDVERGLRHAELVLGSVIHYDELMGVICLLLEQRGAPLPVGEIGKLLQERFGSAAISTRVKLDCGGLKKAIEIHGGHLLGISSDHPYNPTLYLLAGSSGTGSVGGSSVSSSVVSGKTSRSGSDVGSMGSQGGFLSLSRGSSFKEQNQPGGAHGAAYSPRRQHQNHGGNAAGVYGYQQQHQYQQGMGQPRSRGNSNLSDHGGYYYGGSPGGNHSAAARFANHHGAMDPHQQHHMHVQGNYPPQPPIIAPPHGVASSPPRSHLQQLPVFPHGNSGNPGAAAPKRAPG